ncbi:MAG: hypothetical protein JRD68_00120 [Deltaproteobacteria bacterium]|nr:hypothetical protein [Deltaproteobacteria bacterium]
MAGIKETYRVPTNSVDSINNALSFIMDRLDKLEGFRGTPEFQADVSLTDHQITKVADGQAADDGVSLTQLDVVPQPLNIGDEPEFENVTINGLTASRLIATDALKTLESVANLSSWISGTANEIDISDDGDGTITIRIVNPLIVAKGGTGLATITNHGLMLGSGTGAVTPLAAATNGKLPIGSTGVDPVLATLTGTTNQIEITNAAGSITLLFDSPTYIATAVNIANGNYSEFHEDGGLHFRGMAGLPSGDLYIHEGAQTIDISTPGQGVYVKITGMTTGILNQDVIVTSNAFRTGHIGMYLVSWQISGDSDGNNKDYEVDIFVNGVEQLQGSSRKQFGAAASLGSFSGTGIIEITDVEHDIDIRMKEVGAGVGTDFDIFNMNFNILHISGFTAERKMWGANMWGSDMWGSDMWAQVA